MKLATNISADKRKSYVNSTITSIRLCLDDASNLQEAYTRLTETLDNLTAILLASNNETDKAEIQKEMAKIEGLINFIILTAPQATGATPAEQANQQKKLFAAANAALDDSDKQDTATTIANLRTHVSGDDELDTKLIFKCIYHEFESREIEDEINNAINSIDTLNAKVESLKNIRDLLCKHLHNNAQKPAITQKIAGLLANLHNTGLKCLRLDSHVLTFDLAKAIYDECLEVSKLYNQLAEKDGNENMSDADLKKAHSAAVVYLCESAVNQANVNALIRKNSNPHLAAAQNNDEDIILFIKKETLDAVTRTLQENAKYVVDEHKEKFSILITKCRRWNLKKLANTLKSTEALSTNEPLTQKMAESLDKAFTRYLESALEVLDLIKRDLPQCYNEDATEMLHVFRCFQSSRPQIEATATNPEEASNLKRKYQEIMATTALKANKQLRELTGVAPAPAADIPAILLNRYLSIFSDYALADINITTSSIQTYVRNFVKATSATDKLFQQLPATTARLFADFNQAAMDLLNKFKCCELDQVRIYFLEDDYKNAIASNNSDAILSIGMQYISVSRSLPSFSATVDLAGVYVAVASAFLVKGKLNDAIQLLKTAVLSCLSPPAIITKLLELLKMQLAATTLAFEKALIERDINCYTKTATMNLLQPTQPQEQPAQPSQSASNSSTIQKQNIVIVHTANGSAQNGLFSPASKRPASDTLPETDSQQRAKRPSPTHPQSN